MRPLFHFTAPAGWINDPHGITFRDGNYHLFYQYVPDSMVWAPNCHWGHARSVDLFDFQHLPVALAPGEGDDGIWTGSLAIDDDGAATIFYTAVSVPDFGIGRVRTATADDSEWLTWTKGAVVAEVPADIHTVAFRDPFVTRDGDGWRMLVGAAAHDGTALALSFEASTLTSWSYEGVAASRSTFEVEPVWTGRLWECPQVFEIDGRHAMVTSIWDNDVLHYVAYAVGDYVDGRFTAARWGQLSYGDSYYAPSFFRDADGAPSLLFWLRGIASPEEGWAGAHSVPHTLRLEGDVLVAEPHARLSDFRYEPATAGTIVGAAADFLWHSGERLTIRSVNGVLATIDVSADELALTVNESTWAMPYDVSGIRVVVDGPTIEISTRLGLLAAPISPAVGLAFEWDGTAALFELRK